MCREGKEGRPKDGVPSSITTCSFQIPEMFSFYPSIYWISLSYVTSSTRDRESGKEREREREGREHLQKLSVELQSVVDSMRCGRRLSSSLKIDFLSCLFCGWGPRGTFNTWLFCPRGGRIPAVSAISDQQDHHTGSGFTLHRDDLSNQPQTLRCLRQDILWIARTRRFKADKPYTSLSNHELKPRTD